MSDSTSEPHETNGRPPQMVRVRACLECGEGHDKVGEFCSAACRHGFSNRRKNRGAVFLDLYMAHRFEREVAKRMQLLSKINRLAAVYREEDRIERDGRRSWRRPHDVIAERPFLVSVATRIRIGR